MKQLYQAHKDLEIPRTVLETTNSKRVYHNKYETFPFVVWPNRKPCLAINAYFLVQTHVTGATLKTYANQLSHIIRYCYEKNISFDELKDSDMFEFSEKLQGETSPLSITLPARNRNTTRQIINRTLAFLLWLNKTYLRNHEVPLIAEKGSGAQITIRYHRNHHKKKGYNDIYVSHPCMPTKDSPETVRPIPLSVIQKLEQHTEDISLIENQSEMTKRRETDQQHFTRKLEYLRARRRFMIWLLRRTGLRPDELASMTETENSNVLQTKLLIIKTAKRRKKVTPKRQFQITTKDALIVKRYLSNRDTWLNHLVATKRLEAKESALFLSENGKAISKESLTRDFARLVEGIGLSDTKTCLSMFRHRFITYEVIAYLTEFMDNTNKSKILMTDEDYRGILRKVTDKTGHGSPESLWQYIDLAWEEMNVWSSAEKKLEQSRAVEQIHSEILDLKSNIRTQTLSNKQLLSIVDDKLTELLHTLSEGTDNNKRPHVQI
jgi:site-specific recombinase XerD